jgi:hypothetical protein
MNNYLSIGTIGFHFISFKYWWFEWMIDRIVIDHT